MLNNVNSITKNVEISPKLVNLSKFCIDAESISKCLNDELGTFGFISHVIPDKGKVSRNDGGMTRICEIINQDSIFPSITEVFAYSKPLEYFELNPK